jgi:hypothetical protein
VSPLETKIHEFSCGQIMSADAADEKNLMPDLAHPDISIRYSSWRKQPKAKRALSAGRILTQEGPREIALNGIFRAASKLSFRKSAKRRLKARPHAPLRTNGLKTNVD